jgi:type II secretory pathway pseudopilin PulG
MRGFTIIETLIFLAVSGFVFVAAIGQYSSQQKQVEFNQGVHGLQSQLLSMISEVSSSFAPDISGYTCTSNNNNNPLSFTASAGDSSGCIFLGQAIGFGGDGAGAYCGANTSDQCSHYVTIPIVARRQYFTPPGGSINSPVATLAQAQPFALASCSSDSFAPAAYATGFPCGTGTLPLAPTYPNLANVGKFAQSVSISKAFVRTNSSGSPGAYIGGFAFVFNTSNSSFGSTNNKSSVDLVYFNKPFLDNTITKTIAAINGLGSLPAPQAAAQTNPPYGIALCITNGFGKMSVITIGANNSRMDVLVEPSSNFDAGCP